MSRSSKARSPVRAIVLGARGGRCRRGGRARVTHVKPGDRCGALWNRIAGHGRLLRAPADPCAVLHGDAAGGQLMDGTCAPVARRRQDPSLLSHVVARRVLHGADRRAGRAQGDPFDRACLIGCGVMPMGAAVDCHGAARLRGQCVVIGCGAARAQRHPGGAMIGAGGVIAIDLSDDQAQDRRGLARPMRSAPGKRRRGRGGQEAHRRGAARRCCVQAARA